jgi:carbon storage regulator CsrA
MLVLSRKESDRVLFPTLGITVEVLRIQGNTARLGIDAPADVPVVRHELVDLKSLLFTTDQNDQQQLSRLVHAVNGRLSLAAEQLNLLHRHFEETGDVRGQELVTRVFSQLRGLEKESQQALDTESQPPRSARALLVEDDVNQRQLLASYLQLRGFEITTASDGQDALDFLSLHAMPDVVLLDMHMPRCDGKRFVESVRADDAMTGIKLIAVSGTNPFSLGIPSGPCGIDRWFAKPIDPERIVEGIAAELGLPAVAV